MNTQDIITLITQDKWMMRILQNVQTLNLSDWWIGAGFVRSKVWDTLHGYTERTPLPDIDVIYFDQHDFSTEEENLFTTSAEIKYETILKKAQPEIKWSVTNQARMFLLHQHKPYKNSEEALSHWVETATCIGVRLNGNKVILTAPRGIKDLVNLILRPTPEYKKDLKIFQERIQKKAWLKTWPKLKIIEN